MKYISSVIILFLISYISTAQISKNIPKPLYKTLLNSLAGRYEQVDVTMGYAKGIGRINLGNPSQSKFTPFNSFSFSIEVLRRQDQQIGKITNIRIESENLKDYLFRFDWKNDRTDQGTISGEIQLFYSISKNRYETYFINNSSSIFKIFWWSELDQIQKDSLNSVISLLYNDFPKTLLDEKKRVELALIAEKKLKSSFIGIPFTLGDLQVAQYDFPKRLSWDDANKVFTALEEGWRLPNKYELNLLYKNKDRIGGFSNDYNNNQYWSSTEYNKESAFYQDFYDGKQNAYYKYYSLNLARAVKGKELIAPTEQEIKKSIIGNQIKIDNLEFAQEEFPNQMNWQEAIKACEGLGDGWRLPNIDELELLSKNQGEINLFRSSFYWSSTERIGFDGAVYWASASGGVANKQSQFYVRAVKSNELVAKISNEQEKISITDKSIIPTKSEIKKSIIGNTIKISNFEVAENDFPNSMNWYDAEKACEALGDGWRLPDISELMRLYNKKFIIGGFQSIKYWSSVEYDGADAYYLDFSNRSNRNLNKYDSINVRAVRSK